MSPRKRRRERSGPVSTAVSRIWIAFGLQVREARRSRGWTVKELARRAGLSPAFVYLVEAGTSGSIEAAARIAIAFGWRTQLDLVDPRRAAQTRPNLSADRVHSAMGDFEAARFRGLGIAVGIDEPYQHYQFAGRADLVAWDVTIPALLHVENRTRFPDFQEMAGAYNAKRAYLAESLADRLGIRRWASETHVLAALWSSEVLHAIRLRRDSFRAIAPDAEEAFLGWWNGRPPTSGKTSAMIVIDPSPHGRQRAFIALDEAMTARPRYRGYADAIRQLSGRAS